VNEAAEVVTGAADQNANVIFGAVIDDSAGDEVRVTVIATGFGTPRLRRRRAAAVLASPERHEPIRRDRSTESFESAEDIEIPSFLRDD
jgi:cell division protein FtsZ